MMTTIETPTKEPSVAKPPKNAWSADAAAMFVMVANRTVLVWSYPSSVRLAEHPELGAEMAKLPPLYWDKTI